LIVLTYRIGIFDQPIDNSATLRVCGSHNGTGGIDHHHGEFVVRSIETEGNKKSDAKERQDNIETRMYSLFNRFNERES
jgi:hypothetical protein